MIDLILIFSIIILGILCGILTGLLPGLHPNLIASLILSYSLYLLNLFEVKLIIIFIISMSITNAFINFIPSIIFGIPDENTTISVLPGTQMVLEGKGYEAIFLSSVGSFFGVIFAILVIPILFLFLKSTYESVQKFIPYLLIFVIIFLILMEENLTKKFWALIIVLFSSGLGMLLLNSQIFENNLMVIFTGLFGLSGLIYSLYEKQNKMPKQNFDFNFKFDLNIFKAVFIGGISSTICSVSPGIGNAQSSSLSSIFFKDIKSKLYIIVTSSINTIDFVISIVAFYLIERARNGSVYTISQITKTITFNDLIIYILLILVISIVAFFITLYIGKLILKSIEKVNLKLMNVYLIIILTILVYVMAGIYSLLALVCCSFLGLLCISLEIRRVHLMAVLVVPVIFSLI